MRFYRQNEFLFWLLGLSIAIISIIYSINADLVKQYGMEPIWNEEFIKRQLYLHEFFDNKHNEHNKKEIIDKLIALDSIAFPPLGLDTTNNQQSRIVFMIDRTGSTEYNLSKLIGKEHAVDFIKYINQRLSDFNIHLSKPIYDTIHNKYSLSAASIITLTYLLSGNLKDDFAVVFYHDKRFIKLLGEIKNKNSIKIWHDSSELTNEDSLKVIVDQMFVADNKQKLKNQYTSIDTMLDYINQYVDNNNLLLRKRVFLISDLEDENKNKEEIIKEIKSNQKTEYKYVLINKSDSNNENVKKFFDSKFNLTPVNNLNEIVNCQISVFNQKRDSVLNCYVGNIGALKNCSVAFVKNSKKFFKLLVDSLYINQNTASFGTTETNLKKENLHLNKIRYNDCFKIDSLKSTFIVFPQNIFFNNKQSYLIDVQNKVKMKIVKKERMNPISVEGLLLFLVIFTTSLFAIYYRFFFYVFYQNLYKYYFNKSYINNKYLVFFFLFILFLLTSYYIIRICEKYDYFNNFYNIVKFNVFNWLYAKYIIIIISTTTIISTVYEFLKLPNEEG